MKNAVRDMVERMTGGNAKVAEICASTVANLEEGDVCRRLDEEEMRLLSEVPEVVRVDDGRTPLEDVTAPFVVSGDLLYTRRNWQYERNVAERIGRMAGNVLASDVTLPDGEFYSLLRKEQRDAVLAMCKSQFSILTGGPGTGKTHTIARAVKYLQDSYDYDNDDGTAMATWLFWREAGTDIGAENDTDRLPEGQKSGANQTDYLTFSVPNR